MAASIVLRGASMLKKHTGRAGMNLIGVGGRTYATRGMLRKHHGGKLVMGSLRYPVYVSGTRIYDEFLVGLNSKEAKKVFQNASKLGLIPVQREAIKNAPEGDGDWSPVLKKTISIRLAKKGKQGRIGAVVRTNVKQMKKRLGQYYTTYYGMVQEYGAKKTRNIPATRFMLRAAEDKRYVAQRIMMEAMAAKVIKLGSNAGKRIRSRAKEV